MATQPGIYKGIMSRPVATTVADVRISTTRCTGQLQVLWCQKLKMGSFGSMVVAGIKMGKLSEHKGTSYMVSTRYQKMKISGNLGTLDMHMWQSKLEHTSKSNEIVSSINKDRRQLSELVGALKADAADTFLSVVKSICKEHGLPPHAITAVIQGIQISGDKLIHVAARHEAEDMLNLICLACPPLLTAKNWAGDTVWHVVASEGLDRLFKQLKAFRQEQLVTPATYKGGKNSQHLRLNAVNNQGNTALHTSLMSGNESIADDLFEMIPDHESSLCYLPNKEGKSAIYLAAEVGYANLLRRMMNAAVEHPGNLPEILKGKSIIHAAITGKQLVSLNVIMEVAPELFHSSDEIGMTPLQWAARSGGSPNPEVVAYLKAKVGRLQ